MKRNLLLFVALFAACTGFARTFTDDETGKMPVKTLIVDATVTVVLVNSDHASVTVSGMEQYASLVRLTSSNDTLVIGARKDRQLREKVTVYVPANALRFIRINSAAAITTYRALNVSKLDVLVNGACSVSISNVGEVNMSATDDYQVEHTREVRPRPAFM